MTDTDETSRLHALATEKIVEAEFARNRAAHDVGDALSHVEPNISGLGRFLEAVQAAHAVTVWTTLIKREPDNAMMVLHNWVNRGHSLNAHPVVRIVEQAKSSVTRDIVEELGKAGLMTERMMRIYVLGIWGVED